MDQTQIHNAVIATMATILGIDPASIGPDASMDTVPAWDSLSHMRLIVALEQEFEIEFDDEDVVEMLSLPLVELTIKEKVGA